MPKLNSEIDPLEKEDIIGYVLLLLFFLIGLLLLIPAS